MHIICLVCSFWKFLLALDRLLILPSLISPSYILKDTLVLHCQKFLGYILLLNHSSTLSSLCFPFKSMTVLNSILLKSLCQVYPSHLLLLSLLGEVHSALFAWSALCPGKTYMPVTKFIIYDLRKAVSCKMSGSLSVFLNLQLGCFSLSNLALTSLAWSY